MPHEGRGQRDDEQDHTDPDDVVTDDFIPKVGHIARRVIADRARREVNTLPDAVARRPEKVEHPLAWAWDADMQHPSPCAEERIGRDDVDPVRPSGGTHHAGHRQRTQPREPRSRVLHERVHTGAEHQGPSQSGSTPPRTLEITLANSLRSMRSQTLNRNTPPGRNTRATSANAVARSGKNIAPNWQTTTSKSASLSSHVAHP